MDNGAPVEDKTLEAHILVEATAVWQGIAFKIRDAFIMPLACIGGTQEAKVTGLIDHEEVFGFSRNCRDGPHGIVSQEAVLVR